MLAQAVPIGAGPTGLADRCFGPLLSDLAEFMIASLTKYDPSALATLLGHRAGAGDRLQTARTRKALTIITKLGQQRWREKVASAGQRGKQLVILVVLKQLL